MTGDVENLVLEQLRLIRGDMASMRQELREVKNDLDAGLKSTNERIDELTNLVTGVQYVVAVSIGSFLDDIRDLQGRVGALETGRAN